MAAPVRGPRGLPPPADVPSYYSLSQAAALLGVSRMSIWRWVRAGRLPVARLGHRTVRIRREDLERLMAESSHRWVPNNRTIDRVDGNRQTPSDWQEIGVS